MIKILCVIPPLFLSNFLNFLGVECFHPIRYIDLNIEILPIYQLIFTIKNFVYIKKYCLNFKIIIKINMEQNHCFSNFIIYNLFILFYLFIKHYLFKNI